MTGLVAQYIAGAILLIAVFLMLSDPGGTVAVLNGMADFNTSAINALQGQGASRYGTAIPARRQAR